MKHTDRHYPIPPAGVYTANWIPYGYRYDPESPAMLAVDDEVAEAVRYLFRQYIAGSSLTSIARTLEEKGYPSPSRRKLQLGLASHPERVSDAEIWRRSALNQTIFNPIYAGDLIISGRLWDAAYYYSGEPAPEGVAVPEVEENHHAALVSRETMKAACQRYLKERIQRQKKPAARQRTGNPAVPGQIMEISFDSVIHCGECGRSMNEIRISMGGQPSTAYLCSGLSLSQPSKCTNRFYRQSEILSALLPAIEAERKQAVRTLQQISGDNKSQQYSRLEMRLLRQIDKAVDAVRKNMMETRRIGAQHQSGVLSDTDYSAGAMRLQDEDDTYCRQVMQALIRIREFRDICTPDHPWLALYACLPEDPDYSSDPERLLKTVERIDLYPDQPPRIMLAKMREKEELFSVLKKNGSGRRPGKAQPADDTGNTDARKGGTP